MTPFIPKPKQQPSFLFLSVVYHFPFLIPFVRTCIYKYVSCFLILRPESVVSVLLDKTRQNLNSSAMITRCLAPPTGNLFGDTLLTAAVVSQWHALPRSEQSKYYELAHKERLLHTQLHPGWSAKDNYVRPARFHWKSHTFRSEKR